MSKNHSRVDHNQRQKKRQSFASSILDEPNNPVDSPPVSSDNVRDFNLKDMTDEEMEQHLKLCMKLSVENKIDKKNAFGLHLIEIMQRIVNKNEKADIQQASLSLQASSKIYAGRVEALYQDTFRFHGHLQSIVSGGKEKKSKTSEDEIDEDNSENRRSKPQKSKCKSFLKSEESLIIEQDISALSTGEPHGNFVTINSAFSTSRMAPKLLNCLQLANDFCMLRCAIPEPSFKASNALSSIPFAVPPKFKGILEKIKKFSVSHAELKALFTPTEVGPFSPFMSTPKPVAPSIHFDDIGDGDDVAPLDVSMMAGPSNQSMMADPSNQSMMADPSDEFMRICASDHANSLDCAIEKFDVLNITAHAFVNDISAAVTDQGIDHKLLPPNSALKKMLDRSKRTSIKPSVTKTTRLKAKEPFFAKKSANDIKQLFVKGRGTSLSEKTLSEWNVESTSNIDLGYKFIEELENKKEHEHEYNATLDQVLDVIKQNDLQYHFKYYFLKQSQMWKFSRRNLCLNESHPGTSSFIGNQTEKRIGSLAPSDARGLSLSFQNLSLNEGNHDIHNFEENELINEAPDIHDTPPIFEEDRSFNESMNRLVDIDQHFASSESFEMDIEKLMVKPPELVRPASMKFDKRPVNLNTEKITDLMWSIISKCLEGSNSTEREQKFALFSEVYEELKIKLKKEISEFISMQFAFVVLLILANKKTLLIENVKDNTDLSIKQDISEIAVTDNM